MHSNEQHRSFNLVMFVCSLMTTKIQLIAILTLTSILITSGFGVTQLAYSTGSSSDKKGDDKKGDLVLICHDDKEIKYIQQKDLFKQLHDHLIDPNGADVPANQKPNHPASFVIADNPGRPCGHGDDDDDDNEHDGTHDGKSKTATITLFKVLTRDNNPPPYPELDFHMKISNSTKMIDVANGTTIIVNAGTYQMSEINQPGYSFVLIAGDTQCPSKLGTDFIVKGGDKIECTIYNEDDFVEGTNGAGVIFHFDTLQFNSAGLGCSANGPLPCIADFEGSFIIVPDLVNDNSDQDLTTTTLILLTVLDLDDPTNDVGCRITGIDTEPNTGMTGFIMTCPDLTEFVTDDFNANWALIETNPAA